MCVSLLSRMFNLDSTASKSLRIEARFDLLLVVLRFRRNAEFSTDLHDLCVMQ